MALDAVTNFAVATVSTGYAAGATSIVLSTGHGAKLPSPATDGAFNLVWWNSTDYANPSDDPDVEIVRCTARSTDTLTVTRAQESTSDSAKNISDKTYKIQLTITKKMITDIQYLAEKIIAKSSDYTVTGVDGYSSIFISGDTTITLPTAGTVRSIKLFKTDAATVAIIARGGSDTIEGETSMSLYSQYDSLTLLSDGSTTWYRV